MHGSKETKFKSTGFHFRNLTSAQHISFTLAKKCLQQKDTSYRRRKIQILKAFKVIVRNKYKVPKLSVNGHT